MSVTFCKNPLFYLLLFVSIIFTQSCSKDNVSPGISLEDRAIAVLEALESGDTTAIVEYIDPNTYIQHNLSFPSGREALLEALSNGSLDGTTVEVVRSFTDGNFVVTHSDYQLFGQRMVGFDVFRFEGDKIVEHWDNLQVYAGPNPSGRTMLDGPTEVTNPGSNVGNKQLIEFFINDVLISGDFSDVEVFFDGENLIQHNPNTGDGTGIFTGGGSAFFYSRLFALHGSGDFVLAMSEGIVAGTNTAFYNLFRIENDKIVEHWDVVQVIPDESEWANQNGKF